MQSNNLNIVVFDQNQSFLTEQSRVNYSNSRRPTTYDGYSSNQPQAVISNELALLSQKINSLQQKAQKLSELARSSNKQNTISDLNTTTNYNSQPSINPGQIQQLLRAVETKIQIVVRETKKIIEKMTTEFDKKLQKCTSQKNHQNSSIAKIQAHCRETITKIEQSYQQQMNASRNQQMQLEKRLIQRVEILESEFKKKAKQFQNKEQEYIATIQNLQNKIKFINKSKKMIDVTQEKPQQMPIQKHQDNSRSKHQDKQSERPLPISNIRTDAMDNMSNISSQIGSSNALPLNDTSKRRTRIFDSNRSVSPNPSNQNNQVLSPLKPQNSQHEIHTAKQQLKTNQPLTNNYTSNTRPQQPSSQNPQNYQIKSTVIPAAQSRSSATELPVPPKLAATEKPLVRFQYSNPNNDKQQLLHDATSKQFLKDIPKPQWERFQDFNELQNSGSSEQDVFFYPDRMESEPKSVFDTQHNGSMHSPFDIK